MAHEIVVSKQKVDTWADAAFIAEMDKRTNEYESGTAKLFKLEEMENHARKAYKARKKLP